MIRCHTDVVGSLLRPPELIEARGRLEAGAISPADFKAVEDRAVDVAVRLQEEAGLEVVTDGEMRRLSFQSPLAEATDGFGDVPSRPSSGATGRAMRWVVRASAGRRGSGWSVSCAGAAT